jgi:hypothetical protein
LTLRRLGWSNELIGKPGGAPTAHTSGCAKQPKATGNPECGRRLAQASKSLAHPASLAKPGRNAGDSRARGREQHLQCVHQVTRLLTAELLLKASNVQRLLSLKASKGPCGDTAAGTHPAQRR